MQQKAGWTLKILSPEQLQEIVDRHAIRSPEECLSREESCIGNTGMGQALEELQRLMVDIFMEHLAQEPNTPAAYVDDSLLAHMADYHTKENPVDYLRNRWTCGNSQDVIAALSEVRSALEQEYNQMAATQGIPGVAVAQQKDTTATADARADVIAKVPSHQAGTPNYSLDNWAHQALLNMDGVNNLVQWCSANAPEHTYTPAAKAFWTVSQLLANERAKLQEQSQADAMETLQADAPAKGWQPYATAPRDGTRVDIWATYSGGTRITNVRFLPARDVDERFAPGGCWEHLAQDGWRYSREDDGVLVDKDFTHWRLSEADRPPGA